MWGVLLPIYMPTPWAKYTKTTIRGAPSLGNPSCSKLDFSHPSLSRRRRRHAAQPSTTPLPSGQLRSRTGSASCCLAACWSNGQTISSFHHRPPIVAELLLSLLVLRTCVPLSKVKVTNVIIYLLNYFLTLAALVISWIE